MSEKFDAYEYVGIVAPGSIAILGAALLYPDLKSLVVGSDVSLGGLGLFLIMSYVAGHLLQSLGNILEALLWWPFGGMPTQWVLRANQSLIAHAQAEKLFAKVKRLYKDFDPKEVDAPEAWKAVTREIYARVKKADQAQRIDAFNRTYGLLRGIGAGFILVVILLALRPSVDWTLLALLGVCAGLSLYRMYHFGVLYGRELLVTFVTLE